MTQNQIFGVLSYIWRNSLTGALQHCPLWCTASLSPWQAEPTLSEVTATPELAKGFWESSQADTDQTHLDGTHHLTREWHLPSNTRTGREEWNCKDRYFFRQLVFSTGCSTLAFLWKDTWGSGSGVKIKKKNQQPCACLASQQIFWRARWAPEQQMETRVGKEVPVTWACHSSHPSTHTPGPKGRVQLEKANPDYP